MMFDSKKANMFSVILMTFLLFTTGMIVANFLKAPIDDARIALDCSNSAGITDGTKLVCLVCDFSLIYWIILVVSIAGAVILDKVIL